MQAVSNKHLFYNSKWLNQTVKIQGWVRNRRDSKAGISFLTVQDGSCFAPIQVVAPNTLPNYDDQIKHLTKDCAVIVQGTLVASQGKGQTVEIQADSVTVVSQVEDPDNYPMSPKRHTMDHLRQYAHLRPRTNIIGAVARVRHKAAFAIHQFLNDQGYYWVNTPIITTNDCEGAGELFQVSTLDQVNTLNDSQNGVDYSQDFFGQPTFLTVSGQLNVESYCCALSKVYTFGPAFRAENSNTSRHLAEFWMVEPELAFADLNDVVDLAETMLKTVIKTTWRSLEDDFEFFNQFVDKGLLERLQKIIECDFKRLDYTEAIEILKSSDQSFEHPVAWGIDLQSEHERYLCEQYFKRPVVVMNYPKSIKAFYMRLNDDQQTVAAMDVLVPGVGELIGGSQREERLDVLDAQLKAMNIDPAHLDWYRDLRRYGTVPHGGFGLGFERLLSYITGVANIRDVIPFPRFPGHAQF